MGEPNRGWGRDTNLKKRKGKKKKKYFTNSTSCRKIENIVCIMLIWLQYDLHREYKFSRVPELVKFKLMHQLKKSS